jgi:hypothetical protein
VVRTAINRSILQGESIEINFLKMMSLTPDDFIDLAKKILLLLKGR